MIFLHIPKAAGTTFLEILRRQYPKNSLLQIPANRRLVDPYEHVRAIPQIRREQIQVLTGHVSFGIHREIPHLTNSHVTFLRDPVERVISTYYYILGSQEHPLKVEVSQLSLAEFARYSGSAIDNGQTRFISGATEIGNMAPTRPMQRADLESAMQNLENHFLAVGLVERFDESVALMASILNWRKKIDYVSLNVTERRPRGEELKDSDLEAIRETNELDLELYAFASDLFQQQRDLRRSSKRA